MRKVIFLFGYALFFDFVPMCLFNTQAYFGQAPAKLMTRFLAIFGLEGVGLFRVLVYRRQV